MTILGKIIIFVIGWALLVPAMFLCFNGSFLYFILGVIYFVVMVYSGSEIDRKFWKLWWKINKSFLPLQKEYDL